MAEINRISSFKTFSEIKATQVATKLAEENATKRSVLATKISTLLDEMEITSFKDLAEDTKREFITKAFGNVSEEEVEIEIEVADEIEDEEVDESFVNEALVITGKRDAKKVFNQYVKIWNEYSAFGAAGTKHTLGILKQLFFEAMEDANFSREAYSLTKLFKGKIQPLTMKVDSLGGLEVKVPMPKFREAIDQVYSRIANASGWSGIGIVEGTAMFLDSIGEVKTAENLINGFNTQFESVEIRDAKVLEGRAFVAAARKAKDEGLEEFEYDGKKYPVLLKEDKGLITEGTRGQFGKIDKAGNITSVYTHYDSYPENMLPIIKKSFKGGKNVDVVIDKGASSGLDANISKIKFYDDGSEATTGSVKKIDQYLKNAADDDGAEYVYLWDEGSRTWMMADIYGDMELVPAFESVVTEEEVKEGNAFGDAVRKAKEAGETEFEFDGETFKVEEAEEVTVEEGNAFGDAVRKAKEAGETEFEFEGETFKVEEAEEVAVTEGKSEAENILDDLLDERGGDMGELHGMEMEDALDTVEAYGHKGSKAKKIAQELHSLCNESTVTEAKFDKKKLMKAMKQDDGMIQLSNGDEFIIYNPDNGNDENTAMWNDKVIFALDQDGEEHEVKYSDIVSYNEAEVKSDEEFTEYANTVLQKAFGEDFDEAKAKEVIDGILSKSDGDYGAAVGMLTSSLG